MNDEPDQRERDEMTRAVVVFFGSAAVIMVFAVLVALAVKYGTPAPTPFTVMFGQ